MIDVMPDAEPLLPAGRPPDTADRSTWRPLRRLLAAMDDQIGEVYRQAGLTEITPRFGMPLIRLHHAGPMTITELARSVGVTHSAMSQTVTAMRKAGLIRTTIGNDARSKRIALTAKARGLVVFLEAEWTATEDAVDEIEAEIPYALGKATEDIRKLLERKSFRQRILDHLDAGVAAEFFPDDETTDR